MERIQARRDFIGADWVEDEDEEGAKSVRFLDYACGTGLLSRVWIPLFHSKRRFVS